MNEQNKKQIIMAGVLAVVLIGVLVWQFVLAPSPAPPSATTDTPEASTSVPQPGQHGAPGEQAESLATIDIDVEELIQSVEVQPIDYAMVRIRRNPMEPLVGALSTDTTTVETSEVDASGMPTQRTLRRRNVTGIIWDARKPIAIMDDIVVYEGYEFADGVVVHEIEPTRVLLRIGESISTLEMKE